MLVEQFLVLGSFTFVIRSLRLKHRLASPASASETSAPPPAKHLAKCLLASVMICSHGGCKFAARSRGFIDGAECTHAHTRTRGRVSVDQQSLDDEARAVSTLDLHFVVRR